VIRPNYLLIDRSALRSNIQTLLSQTQDPVKYLAVVKANAYGHGILEVAKAALEGGASYIGVAIPEEGKRLREAGIDTPILVFGALLAENAEMVVEYDLCPTVFSCEILETLQRFASQKGKVCPIHIKVDTGMNRIGLKSMDEFIHLLNRSKICTNIRVEGLFTHFAVSEIEDKSFTRLQAKRFGDYIKQAHAMGFFPLLHAANSGAALDLPELHYDMIRGGLSMYGYLPGENCGQNVQLKPVLTWKTYVVHVKDIMPGETVSYGRNFTAKRPTRIATLPVGYGDGYKRSLSNKAQVLLHGQRVPVVGTVCMDQLMCDVTDVTNVRCGDEVVLLGSQGEECIDANEMAAWADTISYEILLSINERVPRIYI